ncbi:MAG: adenosyl-hopene transferase HpnH [Desulfatibacillaceae bacterium]
MAVPLIQQYRVGSYILRQRLLRRARYPLVLMLEPLFACNLACPGCGKVNQPPEVLKQRMDTRECLDAARECGAPVVSIAGGEPLIHPEMPAIVRGMVEEKRFVYLCTNGLLLEKRLGDYEPSPYLTLSVHLDGLRDRHDAAVGRQGVFDAAVTGIREAVGRGFRVAINCTLYEGVEPRETVEFFDFAMRLGIEGIMVAPGFHYEGANSQEVFLKRQEAKKLFRRVLEYGRGRPWVFNHTPLYLDFLAGNRAWQCMPWGNPTRNVLGWQRPCYLLADGKPARTFADLVEATDWDRYGLGRHPSCANCMLHSGFEPTAVEETFRRPLAALWVAKRGPRTRGVMAPDPVEG